MDLNLIAAVDRDWGIGKSGRIPWHIKKDLQFFQKMTTGHMVVMGRNTLESFPGGRPLKGRINVVLSRNPLYQVDGAVTVHMIDDCFFHILQYQRQNPSGKVFIIGGGIIYQEFLPFCNTAYVTKIDGCYEGDTYFPNLDRISGWELAETGEPQEENGIWFFFTKYLKGGA